MSETYRVYYDSDGDKLQVAKRLDPDGDLLITMVSDDIPNSLYLNIDQVRQVREQLSIVLVNLEKEMSKIDNKEENNDVF